MDLTEKAVIGNIAQIRTAQRFTKRMMAERMGINEVSYARIETGAIALSYDHLSKIAGIFDMTVIDLIAWPEKYEKVNAGDIKRAKAMFETQRQMLQARQVARASGENTIAEVRSEVSTGESTVLQEKIAHLEELVREKERLIQVLLEKK